MATPPTPDPRPTPGPRQRPLGPPPRPGIGGQTPKPTQPPPTADQLKATLNAAVASGKVHLSSAQIDAIVAHLGEFFAVHHS